MMKASLENSCLSVTEPRPSLWQKMGVTGMCAVAFLSLYFLMAGPLAWLEGKLKFRPFSQSIKTLYAPLAQLVRQDVEPASSAVKAYVGLFKK